MMLRILLFIAVVCTAVLAQESCEPCPNPVSPTIAVVSMSGEQLPNSNPNFEDILLPGPSALFVSLSPSTPICFVIQISPVSGTKIDLCSVSVTTRFVDTLTLTCGDFGTQSRNDITVAGIQTNSFSLSYNDDQCIPGSLTETCSLCATAPGKEMTIFGFKATACNCCVDCVVGSWLNWGSCSMTCHTGIQTRSRLITGPPNACGQPCPPIVETQSCTNPTYPCVLSHWSEWEDCDAICGPGNQTRYRDIEINPCNASCVILTDWKSCEGMPKVDCVISQWSAWGGCVTRSHATCGGGDITRTREIISQGNECGYQCPYCEWYRWPNTWGCCKEPFSLCQTMDCSTPCCLPSSQQTIDCGPNKAKIANISITGMPLTKVVYKQNPWSAVRGCGGNLILSENSAGRNGLLLTLQDYQDIHQICMEIKFCVTVQTILTGYRMDEFSGQILDDSSYDITTATKGCPSPCCTTDCRCFTTVCWNFPDPPDNNPPSPASKIRTIEFKFIDLPLGKEWIVRNIYIVTCPPYSYYIG